MILAYIDPGAGSLVVQALIATIIALPILFRRQVARVADVVRRRRGNETAGED